MAIVRSRKSKEQISFNTQNRLRAVRVLDIILDINHPLAQEYGNYDAVGTIFYTYLDNNNPNLLPKNASTASPLFSYLKYYPLINEIVLILTTNDKNIYDGKQTSTYYLPQVNMWGHPHHNALPTVKGLESEQTSNDYKETEAGISRQVTDGGTDINLGQYFKEQTNIKPLLPYEGDMILEGRFGNSIRFGSTNISNEISNPNEWSNSGNTGDPITIIRNGQSSKLDEKGWLPTIENISDDGSNIYLTSTQRIRNFKQASPYMDSFNAEYIEPQTLEQSLLEPRPLKKSDTAIGEPVPLLNTDIDLSSQNIPLGVNEIPELNEIAKDAKIENEAENLKNTDNQVIQKDNNISLPSHYKNPGQGSNKGGVDSNFETSVD